VAAGVKCGALTVPEDRANPNGPAVRLAFAVLKATGAHPVPDPVVYLSGDPGAVALTGDLQSWSATFAAPVQSRRDLVFFDQRGTGLSTPALNCPELTDAQRADLATDLRGVQVGEALDAAETACHARLKLNGTNFAGYSSAASAADIADLMAALGYKQYNLIGVSYGSRLALTLMRDRPQHIRSVVLDSALPPQVNWQIDEAGNVQRALDGIISACAAQPSCNAAYPNLGKTYSELVSSANRDPIVVDQMGPEGRTDRIVVNGSRVVAAAAFALNRTDLIPLLPLGLHRIAKGETTILELLVQQVASQNDTAAQAAAESVECNEDTPFYSSSALADAIKGVDASIIDAQIGITSQASLERALALCATWGTPEPSAVEHQAVHSDIPTLILAGSLDAATPPAWAKLAAQTLTRSYVLEFTATGHQVLFARPDCAMRVIAAFVADPSRRPDTGCIGQIAPLSFVVLP
jgi:pimeloyl-ACP methyl ester carboxylesterase